MRSLDIVKELAFDGGAVKANVSSRHAVVSGPIVVRSAEISGIMLDPALTSLIWLPRPQIAKVVCILELQVLSRGRQKS